MLGCGKGKGSCGERYGGVGKCDRVWDRCGGSGEMLGV